MSHCCEKHTESAKVKIDEQKVQSEEPKSFIGKYLYKIGKKEAEKGGNAHGECC